MSFRKIWLLFLLLLAACSPETAVSTPTPSGASLEEQPPASESAATIPETNTPEPVSPTSTMPPTLTAQPAAAETAVPTLPPTPTDASPTRTPDPLLVEKYAQYELITLLPPDAIPAIDNPQFLTVAEAEQFYDPNELILGVEFNGEARAYSIPLLSNHEIVNDDVGGVKIAVTW